MRFTAPGRYTEMLHHINVHKYYLNEDSSEEIPFMVAAESWYTHVYMPIIREIRREKVLSRFPGRTEGDMYMWIVRYWEELKSRYGSSMTVERATRDITEKYGIGLMGRLKKLFSLKKKQA